MPESRTIPTADALRMLPYHSPLKGWHAHGSTLIPTDGCAACIELRRRNAETAPPIAEATDGAGKAVGSGEPT